MRSLRTPDDRFADLPDYPFVPNYVDVPDQDDDEPGGTLRVHYLDEGPRDAAPILLMHGEPSWSYLYRAIIPSLVEKGHRCVAPDLVGFGKSDKPTMQSDYTYARHVAWMRAVIVDHLDIRDATLFAQDWGGLIGLRLVAEHPDRFDRVIIGNTGLPTGEGSPTEAFLAWQRFSQTTEMFDVGFLLQSATETELSPGEVAAYDAPFPDDRFKAGARIFPALVPTNVDDPAATANRAAWAVFEQWDKPFITCFSDRDAVTAGGDAPFRRRVPGAQGQPHTIIEGANHFFQEDAPDRLATVIIDALAR